MIVRWRPRVFISSSIVGLEALRARIRTSIEDLGLAESWIFESNAVAAGPQPSRQYLQAARDCDLFVTVVGDDVRAGTVDEYQEALKDNPDKIIPFLVGEAGSGSAEFRNTLRRHTFRSVGTLEDVPSAIADSVRDYLTSGAVARPALAHALAVRRQELRTLLGLPEGFEFTRRLEAQTAMRLTDCMRLGARVVLSGLAGSGKSDAAVGALLDSTRPDGRLPILVRVRPDVVAFRDAVAGTFDAARFTPGPDLIRQYLRDGRLAVVVDGLDELPAAAREEQMDEIQQAAHQYPRTAMLVVYRSPQADHLPGFTRVTLEALDDGQLRSLFVAAARPEVASWSLGEGFRDLVALPFWAVLLARHHAPATSAVELMDSLVNERLRAGVMADDLARLRIRAALGSVAFASRPSQSLPLVRGLEALELWIASEGASQRFTGRSADLLDAARRTGLVSLEGGDLVFPHPLVAAYLAAQHVVASRTPITDPDDEDLTAFVASLLPESASGELRDLLERSDIFALSAFVRLAPSRARTSMPEEDLVRLNAAYLRWAGHAQLTVADSTISMLLDRGYVCIRSIGGVRPVLHSQMPFDDWASPPPGEAVQFWCWRMNPMDERTPELVAGALVLNRFKSLWNSLRPNGSRFPPTQVKSMDVVEPRGTLPDRLAAFVKAVAVERARLLAQLGLTGSTLDSMAGDPHVTVRVGDQEARFVATWGFDTLQVEILDEEPDWAGESIRELAADPSAVSYDDLQRQLEGRLGSAMASQEVVNASPFGMGL